MTILKGLFLAALPPVALAAVGDILWSDEFTTEGLNSQFWNYDLGTGQWGWGNGELQSYTDNESNVKVDNGNLLITALRNEDGTGFTSGRVNTAGKMEFKYGRVEASIKVPDVADGLWPALWTLGNSFYEVGWPDAGEIDIMEIGQGLAITEGLVNQRIIGGAHWESDDNLAAYSLWLDFPEDLNLQYRNYTLDWTPTRLSTFVDGTRVWTMDISEEACPECEEFHKPHFLITNLAVGGLFTSTGSSGSSSASSSSSSAGGCTGSSSASSAASSSSSSGGCGQARTDVSAPLPATMFVDFVRVIDNGFTEVNVDVNIFESSNPVVNPTAAPIFQPAPLPTTNAPVPTPTIAPPTPAPVIPPSSEPPVVTPTVAPIIVTNPTPQPQEFVSPSAPTGGDRNDGPALSPTLAPVPSTPESADGDEDGCENGKSGKGGKGKSGKGVSRRRARRRRLECDEEKSGKSGKGGKGKSSKKGGSSEATVEVAFASLTENSAAASSVGLERLTVWAFPTLLALLPAMAF